jgi:hypothetical protein
MIIKDQEVVTLTEIIIMITDHQLKEEETLPLIIEAPKIIITVVEAPTLTTIIIVEAKIVEIPLKDKLEVAPLIKEEEAAKEIAVAIIIQALQAAVIDHLEEVVQIITIPATTITTGMIEREIVSITIKEMKRLTDMEVVAVEAIIRHQAEVEINPLHIMEEVAPGTHQVIRSHHLIYNLQVVAVLIPAPQEVLIIYVAPLVLVVAVVQVLHQVGP